MKKVIFKRMLSRNDRKAMMRNGGVLTDHNQNRVIIMLAIRVKLIKAKLGFSRSTRDAQFLTNSNAIYQAFVDDVGGFFTVPFTQMVLFNTQLVVYSKAITKAKLKGLGSSAEKETAKNNLYGILLNALSYVNDLARTNIENAVSIIEEAKMVVAGSAHFKKQDFYARQGAGTGEVKLFAIAVKVDGKYVKATYFWQFSIDAGVTWIDMETTTIAKTLLTGMVSGKAIKLRKRTKSSKTGLSKWSNPIDFTPQ